MRLKAPLNHPRKDWPKFCEYDGKPLKESRQIKRIYFDKHTGIKMRRFFYFRFCPDWQQERDKHTEYWPKYWEYEDEPVEDEA